MLLNRRAQTLTYPTWQLAHLREIRIPKSDNPAWGKLRAAFDQACDTELLPMKHAKRCVARWAIDRAAALACDLDPDVLADWRSRLSAEPTITNRPAPDEDSRRKKGPRPIVLDHLKKSMAENEELGHRLAD